MGLFRKAMSVSTLGAVDMRSDKERTAAYSKSTMKENKKQTALMRQEQAREGARWGQEQARRTPAPGPGPAAPAPAIDIADQLERLAALRDKGVLTQEEFDTQKAKILGA